MAAHIISKETDFGIFLKEVATDVDKPWAVVGDFNSLLHDHERNKRPTQSSLRSMMAFKNNVIDRDLIDAGFQGLSFHLAPWRLGGETG